MFSFFKTIPSISTKELEDKLSEKITLLDVRTPEEYRQGHIAIARNYPLNQIQSFQEKKDTIYVICQSGMRSKNAAKQLTKKGYQVVNVRGGMNQWKGRIV